MSEITAPVASLPAVTAEQVNRLRERAIELERQLSEASAAKEAAEKDKREQIRNNEDMQDRLEAAEATVKELSWDGALNRAEEKLEAAEARAAMLFCKLEKMVMIPDCGCLVPCDCYNWRWFVNDAREALKDSPSDWLAKHDAEKDAQIAELVETLAVAEEYLAARVSNSGTVGRTIVLPKLREALTKHKKEN